ncbi:MAG: hypothetical protein A4E45_02016 [Methanosaeta sp. PtaB.Bin039]|nr:MAG: hypothetical protein A4E45_02016 [Methanosaeta sp. PtaB.Bin039]OPY46903.1 MAG: hypothetical protein A4E47_00428 [Methanosaeta sp. PtaU1.Bin028]HQF17647.1 hypothetical protein [Methanotrichaceae archaeon]HQI92235.1 hypothetical protein [Methanotrichaceae archaeon]
MKMEVPYRIDCNRPIIPSRELQNPADSRSQDRPRAEANSTSLSRISLPHLELLRFRVQSAIESHQAALAEERSKLDAIEREIKCRRAMALPGWQI